jgi:SAM-dependent methyltransferase
MAAAPHERYGDALFNSNVPDEYLRLQALAAAFDPLTFQRLAALRPRPGWRCLDVGAGPGTVSRWLADRIGAGGTVVACDRDTSFVTARPHPQVDVLTADVTDPAFDPGQFDLVHVRFLLMHLRERDALLPRLASWVRPGGYLVVSDSADLGTPSSPHAAYRTTLAALWDFLADTIGTDINYGRRHPTAFALLGLADTSLHVDMPSVHCGSPLAFFWTHTLSQALPRLTAGGALAPDTAREALDYLADPDLLELSVAMITTIGRQPLR